MRCEHHVPGRAFKRGREVVCRRRLRRLSTPTLVGAYLWRIYYCSRGHETRVYVDQCSA